MNCFNWVTRTLLGSMAAVALSASFAAGGARADEPKIALVLPGPNAYFEPWNAAINDAARTYHFSGIYGVPATDAFDLTHEDALMDSLAGRGYTGFGVFPGDAHGTNAEEQKLAAHGIKSININGCTYDPSPALFCVSTNIFTAAYYQTQQLIKAIGGKGEIALLTSQLTDPNTQLRIRAVEKAVAETHGSVTLAQTVANIDTPQSAPPAINALLAARGNTLAGVMSTSYNPSVAMASSLTDNPQFRHIKFIAAENSPQVMNALQKGYIYGTLFQNTYGQAYVASYALHRVLHDKCTVRSDAPFEQTDQTKKLLAAGVLLVTNENVGQFVGKPEALPDDTQRLLKLVDTKVLECK